MHTYRAALAAIVFAHLLALPVAAQTTAGSATTIVVPVTAQTTTFTSEVTVYNPNGVAVTVDVRFYAANNSSPPPGLRVCADVVVPANRSVQFSLAGQCTLGAGSHFGLLILADLAGVNPIYGYVRTQNFAGQGFSTEGFPAENFNNQVSHTTGLKKTISGVIYQTNCFAGSLAQAVTYTLKLFNGTSGAQIGGTINGNLGVFQQVRYLDVFGVNGVNAPNVNQMNVRAEFASTNGALLVGFCTVQDNSSFGADFRIAKSYGTTAAYVQGGNSFGATAILGTTDNQALDVRVNNARVMRYEPNAISPNVIGGHPANNVAPGVRGATIGGGGLPAGNTDPDFQPGSRNGVTDAYGTIGGGFGNLAGDAAGTTIDAPFATVGGGRDNEASGPYSAVGGGTGNAASGFYSTVGGGTHNAASGVFSTVGGGTINAASGSYSTVGGGFNNDASDNSSTVGGGSGNTAAGSGTVGGGNSNDASAFASTVGGGQNNTASGLWSTVVGGSANEANGNYSVAMGRSSKANADGSFSFADSNAVDFNTNTVDSFRVRATGGVRFVVEIDGSGGTLTSCLLNSTTVSWSCSSDRNLKQDLERLDGEAVLDKLIAMPVYAWSPKGRAAQVRHFGPMAQDFHAAFGLGDDDTMIGMQDADGVALAAIQGLNAKLEAKVAEQAREIAELKRVVEVLLVRTSAEGRLAVR